MEDIEKLNTTRGKFVEKLFDLQTWIQLKSLIETASPDKLKNFLANKIAEEQNRERTEGQEKISRADNDLENLRQEILGIEG